jgi:hypothetical protein
MKKSIFLFFLLPFVFAACQNPTAADYVPPPPSYEPEPPPSQPPPPAHVPPAFISQDLEALYQNLWRAFGVHGGGIWRAQFYSPVAGAIYAYIISDDVYWAMAAHLQGFHVNTSATTLVFSTGGWAVTELSITAHSLTLVKYNNLNPSRRTQHIVPRYVRL